MVDRVVGLLRTLQFAFYQNFIFDGGERLRFLTALENQVKAGIPLSRIFQQFSLSAYSGPVQKLADSAMRQEAAGNPLTSAWGEEGMFPATDAALLTVAERHNALGKMTEVLRQKDDKRISFLACVVAPNSTALQGIGMAVLTLFGMLYLEDSFMQVMDERPEGVIVAELLLAWAPVGAAVVTLLYLAYEWGARSLHDDRRDAAKRWLRVYTNRDRKFGVVFCRMAAHLLRMGISEAALFATMRQIYASHPAYRYVLEQGAETINAGGTLVDAMDGVIIASHHARFLRMLAPRETPQELARVLPTVADQVAEEVLSSFKAVMQTSRTAMFGAMAWILLELVLPTMMGVGLMP